MTTTLFTFLGRPSKNERGEYRRAAYDFGGGDVSAPVAFFGWPLAERVRPERVVILGTSGSAWDHVFEADHDLGGELEERRIALPDIVTANAVEADHIEPFETLLSARRGIEVRLRLIPYCATDAEQVELLRILAGHVGEGDQVHLDITHGFRTLPMLALLGALYLRRTRGARIGGVWYGLFDPDTGAAPVQNLAGMLEVANWLEALAVYDHSGDYGPAARLLHGRGIGDDLECAAFCEQINELGRARKHAKAARNALELLADAPASVDLFRPELLRRLEWARLDQFYSRQRQVALERLERGQFLAAVLAGQEAFISRLVSQTGGDPMDYRAREAAQARFEDAERGRKPRSPRFIAWGELCRLRNAITHGSRPGDGAVRRAMADAGAMRRFVERVFAELLPAEETGG